LIWFDLVRFGCFRIKSIAAPSTTNTQTERNPLCQAQAWELLLVGSALPADALVASEING
jgi:hypothetical protein